MGKSTGRPIVFGRMQFNEILKLLPTGLSRWSLVFIWCFYTWAHFDFAPWEERYKKVIDHDVIYYYSYLPAAFIEKDLALDFYKDNPEHYHKSRMYWPEILDDGSAVIKVSYGTALAYLPFFTAAHLYCQWNESYAADGFSKPYHVAIALSGWFWMCVGFYFLRKLLIQHFTEWESSLTLLILALATNLFYTLLLESALSHPFSFSIGCLFLWSLDRFRRANNWQALALMALSGGWLLVIRPTNAIYLLLPFLYWPAQTSLADEWKWWLQQRWRLLLALLLFILPILPQLAYWKIATGHWVSYSYTDERFFFANPHLLEGLFSYRKGWLVYTPIMLLSVFGLIQMGRGTRAFRFWPWVIAAYIYVVYSWWCWWYGGGFGSRVMVDVYPILAIALAEGVSWFWRRKNIAFPIILLMAIGFFSWWNFRQTDQYWRWRIHYDSMTKEAYWFSVKHRHAKDVEPFEKLLKAPDYQAAFKGEDEYPFQCWPF